MAQQLGDLAEVRRDQVDPAGVEVRPGDVGEEVADVAQVLAVDTGEVAPVVQRVHLVDLEPTEVLVRVLDRVEQRHRLAVGQRHDDPRAVVQVLEHVGGGTRSGVHAGLLAGVRR